MPPPPHHILLSYMPPPLFHLYPLHVKRQIKAEKNDYSYIVYCSAPPGLSCGAPALVPASHLNMLQAVHCVCFSFPILFNTFPYT